MNDNEKIKNLENEIQELKNIIEILAKDAKFSPVKAETTPDVVPPYNIEDSPNNSTNMVNENGEIIDVPYTSYDPEEFDIENGLLHEYLGESEEVTIPYGVTKIGNCAFQNNRTIKKINLPETVKEIGKKAFSECNNLVEVNISGNDIIIGTEAFSSCCSLEKINIDNIKEIYNRAFRYCSNLKRLRLSENTELIGEGAFSCCNNLRISIPETCKYYAWAFNGCKSVIIREVTEK
ncbi:MAG: leucine-rich repeat domain-containing protein [Ruminococcus sp.]|nr:leucine-rich repeat domain-containing protein [Ruminococcus sp.]